MAKDAASPQGAGVGFLLWSFLGALGWVFLYADRAVFSPLLREFGRLFHVGPAALGLVSASFFLSYTLAQIPAGILADRVSPRLLLGVGYIGFGIVVAWTALAWDYAALLAFSSLAGLLQGIYYPVQFAVTARKTPPAKRPLANAVITAGMGAGIALGYMAGAVVGGNWRQPLWLLGAATVLVGAILTAAAPRGADRTQQPKEPLPFSRDFVLLLLINFCSLYAFFFLLAWLPYYLQTGERLAGGPLALLSSWPTIVAVPATIAWSRSTAPGRLRRMRILMLAAATALAAIPLAHGPLLAGFALTLYGLTGKLVLDPLILSQVAESLPQATYGRAFGILNFAGMSASVLAPLITGLLIPGGGIAIAFLVAAALLLCSLALSFGLSRPTPQAETTES